MNLSTFATRRTLEQLDRDQLTAHQLRRLNSLLERILPGNSFYAEKLGSTSLPIRSLDDFRQLPFTTKDELASDKTDGGLASNLSFPPNQYVRFHRTSGTRGQPMIVLDTAEDWQWWIDTWQFVLDAAEVTPDDRAAMAFSFGPFIGFWSANDALAARNALVIPGGGMGTVARLDLILQSRASVLCCTPSYALHLASVAQERNISIADSSVRAIIVAGEPGGSAAVTRERIESAWQARLIDHAGATEIGPWGYGNNHGTGLHVVESEFMAEFISLETSGLTVKSELSELVLTTLGRDGAPVIRYRTGDLVRPVFGGQDANRFVFLEGGVLGRVDDMMIIRGVNVFPSAVEQILRKIPEINEYRMTVRTEGEMDALSIEVEDPMDEPTRIVEALRRSLGLTVDVRCVEPGSLPRFELKGHRFVDERKS